MIITPKAFKSATARLCLLRQRRDQPHRSYEEVQRFKELIHSLEGHLADYKKRQAENQAQK